MSTSEIHVQVQSKLDAARAALDRAIAGNQHVCLTCSFQAEDVLLAKLAVEFNPRIPVLFLDTGYHFAETYAYRDRIASEWQLNLINLLPSQTVAEQEAQHGLLYQSSPDQCCKTAQGRTAVQGCCRLSCVDYWPAPGAGKEPSCARRVCAFHAARRRAGHQACATGCVDNTRCVVCLRVASNSLAAALRARLFLHRLRALYDASA